MPEFDEVNGHVADRHTKSDLTPQTSSYVLLCVQQHQRGKHPSLLASMYRWNPSPPRTDVQLMKRPLPVCVGCLVSEALDAQQALKLPTPRRQRSPVKLWREKKLHFTRASEVALWNHGTSFFFSQSNSRQSLGGLWDNVVKP